MILKVLNEEETGDESSSVGDMPVGSSSGGGGGGGGNNNAMVAAFATGVGGLGEDDGNATVEVAIPEEGGPGATAMLNLDSVKVYLHYATKPCDALTHGNLATFNNGLGTLKTKTGGGIKGGL